MTEATGHFTPLQPCARLAGAWGGASQPEHTACLGAPLLGTARGCPLPGPGSTPELRCSLGPRLQGGQTWPAAYEAKGLRDRGQPQTRGLAPSSPQ